MDPRLSAIIELQDVLSIQRDIELEYSDIPKRRNEIEEELLVIRKKVETAENRLKENELERSTSDLDLKKAQELRVRKESQLQTIKSDKEYQATTAEIANLDKRNSRLEERLIELMEQIETDQKTVEDQKAKLTEKEEFYKDELAALDKVEKNLSPRMKEAEAAVESIQSTIPPELASKFKVIFNGKNGMAIASANEGFCSVCNIRLTPRIMQLAKRGQDLVHCEGCSRYLYWASDKEEEFIGEL
jgi:predicted  nucleic acid-binding Zn-ribbon protein